MVRLEEILKVLYPIWVVQHGDGLVYAELEIRLGGSSGVP